MEDVALEARMRGIGDIIEAEAPHIVCLQEATHNIVALFRASPWWRAYEASPSPGGCPYFTLLLLRKSVACSGGGGMTRTAFADSGQGRDLLCGSLSLGGGVSMRAATTHLESYLSAAQTSSAERVAQMRAALKTLSAAGTNVVLAGDTNWDDATDGNLDALLPPGWADAWRRLRPGEPGYTYDAVANAMLMGRLQKRLDRVLFCTRDYEPAEVRMVGTAPLRGVTYEKAFRNGGSKRLPVCPSDHFGLLLTLRRVERRGATTAA
jgi:tyrosyl-DNA phosphodiesterase 2